MISTTLSNGDTIVGPWREDQKTVLEEIAFAKKETPDVASAWVHDTIVSCVLQGDVTQSVDSCWAVFCKLPSGYITHGEAIFENEEAALSASFISTAPDLPGKTSSPKSDQIKCWAQRLPCGERRRK